MQEDMTSCYAFTRYEQDCIYDSLHEFVLSKYFNSRCLKDVLDEVEVAWLNSLFVIIKASLLKLVFHETYVCTRGGNTRYQNDFARAQHNDAALKNEMIRNCIRGLFELADQSCLAVKSCLSPRHLLQNTLLWTPTANAE